MKVAIVHDWLVDGGAERVIEELHKMYPDAPIYTSYATDEWRNKLDGKVVTGFLQNWPFSKLRKFLPVLRIFWFTHLDFSSFDLVISSSGNGEAKGVRTPKNVKHICYCHAPTHFYWRHYKQYIEQPGFGIFNPIARIGLRLLVNPLRKWDLKASKRPDFIIANSAHTQSEIKQFYNRDSVVVHPPVDTSRFSQKSNAKTRNGFITVGRLKSYKKIDVIIDACTKLNLPLSIVGVGPELQQLKKNAGQNVNFLGWVGYNDLPDLLAEAEAFIFASYEDFGIAPVEAMASGTPIIAYRAGGALDYVVAGETGEFFDEQSTESLISALENFKPGKYSSDDIRKNAESFSVKNFRDEFHNFVKNKGGT